MQKLLLIDDDTEVLALNKKYFTREGYEVKSATCAADGISLLNDFQPDCIILDVMMPGMDGFQACRRIKMVTKAPIIFLTGRSFEEDKVKGLLLGADDYMIKPYSLRELSARILIQIRRFIGTEKLNNNISCPPLLLNLISRKALYEGEEIPLSNREYELLLLLVRHPNQTVTFEEIGKSMWGSCSDADRRTIMVTASRLRKKLEEYIGIKDFIETVWTKGYQYVMK